MISIVNIFIVNRPIQWGGGVYGFLTPGHDLYTEYKSYSDPTYTVGGGIPNVGRGLL